MLHHDFPLWFLTPNAYMSIQHERKKKTQKPAKYKGTIDM